jgi:lysophospholipase L1-like esterase
VFADLIEDELRAQGLNVDVVNAGVGGNTTAMARARFERDVLSKEPRIVTISFGVNDSAVDVWKGATEPRVSLHNYEENLRHFIRALREQGSEPILMTPNPLLWTPGLKSMYGKPPYDPDAPDGFTVTLRAFTETVRRLAGEEDVSLVDTDKAFRSGAHGPLESLLLDGMHPNDVGHCIVAGELMRFLAPMLGDSAPSE